MRFNDRADAGRQLGQALAAYRRKPDTIILALPRGGVPVAFEVAQCLDLPLDVFLVRKLGLPQEPEVAMGAIASGGLRVINDDILKRFEVSDAEVNRVAAAQEEELLRREQAYRGDRPRPDLRGKTVIVIDDGLATGASMRAAVRALRLEGPDRIIAAVPVAPAEEDKLLPEADEVVCLLRPERFFAVGNWYVRFRQTEDAEVRELLARARDFGGSGEAQKDGGAGTSKSD